MNKILIAFSFFLVGIYSFAQVNFQQSSFKIGPMQMPGIEDLVDVRLQSLGDLDGDGDADVVAYGKRIDGLAQYFLWILENQAGSSFVLQTDSFDFATLIPPLIVDLNQDGLMDIISFKYSATAAGRNLNVVLINQGNFNFSVDTLSCLDSIIIHKYHVLDANNDGYPDLLVNGDHNSQAGYTAVYLNDSTGNFFASGIPLGIYQYPGMAVLDKNGDGFDDIIMSGSNSSNNYANHFLRNTTNGSFITSSYNTTTGYFDSPILTGDFDQDNHPDFVVSSSNSTQRIDLYLNNHPATGFTRNYTILNLGSQGYYYHHHLILDIDNDGKDEIITQLESFSGPSLIKYYKLGTNGNFYIVPNSNSGDLTAVKNHKTIDINGDGYTDIYDPYSNEIFYNDQANSFIKPKQFKIFERGVFEFRRLDFNQDGYDDFLLSTYQSNTSGLYLNINGSYFERQDIPFFDQITLKSIAAVDLDGDNDLDFVGKTGLSFVLINNGNGQFTSQASSLIYPDREVMVLNYDNLHQLDILMVEQDYINSHLELKFYTTDVNGNLNLVTITGLPNIDTESNIALGDVNKDGLDDVYIGYPDAGSNYGIYINNGNNSFTKLAANLNINQQTRKGETKIVDIDNDGDIELVSSGFSTSWGGFKVFHYDSAGSYFFSDPDITTDYYSSFDLGDLNNDSLLDGALYNTKNDELEYFLYLPNDDIQVFSIASGDYDNAQLRMIDFDGDGDQDLFLSANYKSNPFARVYENIIACNLQIIKDSIYSCNKTYKWRDGKNYNSNIKGVFYQTVDSNGCNEIYELKLIYEDYDGRISTLNNQGLTSNDNGVSYQWLNCDNGMSIIPGATAKDFYPSIDGYYAVEINTGNCIDTSFCMKVEGIGLSEFISAGYKLYPNPGNGNFYVETPSITIEGKIFIYSGTGQLVFSKTLATGTTHHPILNTGLKPGVYHLQIHNSEGIYSEKVVIEE